MAGRYSNAISSVWKGLKNALSRAGVKIGSTATYPRVEIHSITEAAPLDKDGRVRQISCTVECLSQTRVQDVFDLAEGNAEKFITKALDLGADWRLVGIIDGQTRFMEEAADSANIIYRLMRDITVVAERV